MMLNKNDQERVTQLLTDAITVLCKNGLSYDSQFSIEGLLGITLDEREVFLVKIDETVRGHGAAGGDVSGEYKAPPGITHQRTAVTSPRMRGARPRGRPLVTSRGRFSSFGNRKRNLFGGAVRPQSSGVSNSQSAISHGGGGGEPPNKMRLQGDSTPSTTPAQSENVIEIGDEDSSSPRGRVTGSDIKTEPPDFPNTMPADSTQGPDSKYTLDNETSKSLTDFLDNLMTAHGAKSEGGGSSTSQSASNSSPAAAGSSALSHLAQMASPKSEPPSWDQQQYGSSVSGSSPVSQPQQSESGGRQFAWIPLQIPKIKLSEPGVVATTPIKFATPTKKASGNARRKPANPRKAIKNSAAVNFNGNSPAKDFDAITLFQCKYCENTFTSKTGLQNHIFSQHKDHTQKQFACDKCPKRFMTYGSLHRHKNAHKGIYAHKCPICEKGFANGKDLEGHMYKHTGVKPFQCTGCEMTFAYKCNLMSHIKTMHKNNVEMV